MSQVQEQKVVFRNRGSSADKKLRDLRANELVFAVVGPVGSGTSWVANTLAALLRNSRYAMDVHIIKASDVITQWATSARVPIDTSTTFAKVISLQNAGDAMREGDAAAVGLELIAAIKSKRETLRNPEQEVVTPIKPVETSSNGRTYLTLSSILPRLSSFVQSIKTLFA